MAILKQKTGVMWRGPAVLHQRASTGHGQGGNSSRKTDLSGCVNSGDFRMVIGEEKAKVLNIVKPNVAHFRELYESILQKDPQVVYKTHQGQLEVSCAPAPPAKGRAVLVCLCFLK